MVGNSSGSSAPIGANVTPIRNSSIVRNSATSGIEPLPSSGAIVKPDSSAAMAPAISTGLRPKRSAAAAASGVASAMNSTAKHSRPRKLWREKCSVETPYDSENTVEI